MTTPPRCAICGTTEQLLRCAKCKTIYYCSSAHQHVDWPMHKQECRLLARQKNNNKIQQLQQAVAATTLDSNSSIAIGGQSSVLPMQNNGTGVSTANCSTAQMMTPVSMAQPPSPSDTYSPDIIDNILAMLPPDFGNENVLTTMAPRNLTNASNSNHMNGSTNMPPISSTNGLPQGYMPHINHVQTIQQQQQELLMPPPPAMISSHNGQHEKSSSYQIGLADANFMGNANERRYEDLCRNIINDMNQYGLSVVDDFLGLEKGLKILNEVHRMYNAGHFKDGQLVNNMKTEKDLRTIRGDKIAWVKGLEPGCSNVGYLINQIDAVIYRANTMKNNGILGNYNIRERTKAMVACYPGSGAHYVTHVDNPNKDGRVITAIYYLNIDWNAVENGGILRIFPTSSNTVADIAPKFDRLIFFWSDKRNPHEVQPAHRTRYAITVWYFDANEREAALNRCKYQNNVNTNPASKTKTNTNTETALAEAAASAAAAVAKANTTTESTTTTTALTGTSLVHHRGALHHSMHDEPDSTTSPLASPNATVHACKHSAAHSEICT